MRQSVTAKISVMRIVGANRIANHAVLLVNVILYGLSFDFEDNIACSNPLTPAVVDIKNGGEINEEAANDNK